MDEITGSVSYMVEVSTLSIRDLDTAFTSSRLAGGVVCPSVLPARKSDQAASCFDAQLRRILQLPSVLYKHTRRIRAGGRRNLWLEGEGRAPSLFDDFEVLKGPYNRRSATLARTSELPHRTQVPLEELAGYVRGREGERGGERGRESEE